MSRTVCPSCNGVDGHHAPGCDPPETMIWCDPPTIRATMADLAAERLTPRKY